MYDGDLEQYAEERTTWYQTVIFHALDAGSLMLGSQMYT
jgi:hypothetical protein